MQRDRYTRGSRGVLDARMVECIYVRTRRTLEKDGESTLVDSALRTVSNLLPVAMGNKFDTVLSTLVATAIFCPRCDAYARNIRTQTPHCMAGYELFPSTFDAVEQHVAQQLTQVPVGFCRSHLKVSRYGCKFFADHFFRVKNAADLTDTMYTHPWLV